MSNQKSILIIDDEVEHLELMHFILNRAGYRVINALDGQRGLKTALDERPDLIMLDIRMPRMSGIEVIQRLRANKITADIPVVVLSASNRSMRELDNCLNAGATSYMLKPFELDNLMKCVKNHIAN